MCEDCRVANQERKIAQFEEPRERPLGTRKKSEKTKGKKVRLDELKQAVQNFWQAFEWEEEAKAREASCKRPGHHTCWHRHKGWLESRTEKLNQIFAACRKDGLI